MAIRTDRAGADAIKMPTLLNSKLLIAIINKRFAMISQVPESSAYLRQPTGLVNTFLSLFGEKIIEISNAPILAPNIAAKISLVSIKVIINEKPEKKAAAAAARKKALSVAF